MPKYEHSKHDRVKTMKNTDEEFVIGPNGEKRPANDYDNAVRIMRIATGLDEVEYVTEEDLEKMRGD